MTRLLAVSDPDGELEPGIGLIVILALWAMICGLFYVAVFPTSIDGHKRMLIITRQAHEQKFSVPRPFVWQHAVYEIEGWEAMPGDYYGHREKYKGRWSMP
jgi:hypothetical protein